MDGREGMLSFYLNRGVSGTGSHAGLGSQVPLPGFTGSSYQVEHNPSHSFPHDFNMDDGGGAVPITTPRNGSDSIVKKKRGRPRKYSGDGSGSHMSFSLIPVSPVGGSPGSSTLTPKRNKGRPPGSGRKQRLANVGEWMSTSAGGAFTPHIIHVEIGEDVAAKILSFAQQRPRALCIMSGNGAVSAVQVRLIKEDSPDRIVTYEGHFDILSLSGSYLLPETGALNNRTGGLSILICSPDGHIIGGTVSGRIIASSLIQVVACSFVHGVNNPRKIKTDAPSADENSPSIQLNEPSFAPSQTIAWPTESRGEFRNSHSEIDLTHG